MGNPIDDETLKETRGNLVKAFAEQDKKFGAVPEVERYEKFIDPILRKVEVDARTEPEPVDAQAREREGAAERAEREGFRVERETIGQFDFRTGRQLNGNTKAVPVRREGPHTQAARYVFAAIRHAPGLGEWRQRLDKIVYAPQTLAWKNIKYSELLADFIRVYGNPLKKRDPKIFSRGK